MEKMEAGAVNHHRFRRLEATPHLHRLTPPPYRKQRQRLCKAAMAWGSEVRHSPPYSLWGSSVPILSLSLRILKSAISSTFGLTWGIGGVRA